jgi:hypothetical protein
MSTEDGIFVLWSLLFGGIVDPKRGHCKEFCCSESMYGGMLSPAIHGVDEIPSENQTIVN